MILNTLMLPLPGVELTDPVEHDIHDIDDGSNDQTEFGKSLFYHVCNMFFNFNYIYFAIYRIWSYFSFELNKTFDDISTKNISKFLFHIEPCLNFIFLSI